MVDSGGGYDDAFWEAAAEETRKVEESLGSLASRLASPGGSQASPNRSHVSASWLEETQLSQGGSQAQLSQGGGSQGRTGMDVQESPVKWGVRAIKAGTCPKCNGDIRKGDMIWRACVCGRCARGCQALPWQHSICGATATGNNKRRRSDDGCVESPAPKRPGGGAGEASTITPEQRQRMEANRLAALERRRRSSLGLPALPSLEDPSVGRSGGSGATRGTPPAPPWLSQAGPSAEPYSGAPTDGGRREETPPRPPRSLLPAMQAAAQGRVTRAAIKILGSTGLQEEYSLQLRGGEGISLSAPVVELRELVRREAGDKGWPTPRLVLCGHMLTDAQDAATIGAALARARGANAPTSAGNLEVVAIFHYGGSGGQRRPAGEAAEAAEQVELLTPPLTASPLTGVVQFARVFFSRGDGDPEESVEASSTVAALRRAILLACKLPLEGEEVLISFAGVRLEGGEGEPLGALALRAGYAGPGGTLPHKASVGLRPGTVPTVYVPRYVGPSEADAGGGGGSSGGGRGGARRRLVRAGER